MYRILFCNTEIDVPINGLCIQEKPKTFFSENFVKEKLTYSTDDLNFKNNDRDQVFYFNLVSDLSNIRSDHANALETDDYEDLEINPKHYVYSIQEIPDEIVEDFYSERINKKKILNIPFYYDEPFNISSFNTGIFNRNSKIEFYSGYEIGLISLDEFSN